MKAIKGILSFILTFLAKRQVGAYGPGFKVNFYSRFTAQTFLGANCHFNGLRIRGTGKVSIGDNFHSGQGILLVNTFHKYEDSNALPYDTQEVISKEIKIGDNVWIGDKVIVLGGLSIGEGAIIQAGAVVVHDIPEFAIAGGNPAQVFKQRNVDNYLKLKAAKRFC